LIGQATVAELAKYNAFIELVRQYDLDVGWDGRKTAFMNELKAMEIYTATRAQSRELDNIGSFVSF